MLNNLSHINLSTNTPVDNKISVKDLIKRLTEWVVYLLGKWKIIILCGLIGGTLGFFYALSKKPIYKAKCTFVLEEGDKGGLGAMSGLASLAGIDINSLGGGTNGIFQGDNIIELYKSRSMIVKTLLSTAKFKGKEQLLIDRYIEFYKIGEKLKDISADELKFGNPPFSIIQDSIITEIVDNINENHLIVGKPDKKLSIISVEVNSEDQLFAKAFTNSIVKNVNDFYVSTKTKKSVQNIQILQRQADSVKGVLNRSISGVAASIDANPNINPAMQILKTPSQRRQVDVQASSAIYAEIVKNLEISKISVRKETPLIQVIDEPVLPLKKTKPSKLMYLIVCSTVAGMLCSLILVWKKMYFE